MKRILLKLSGEALAGANKEIYDMTFVDKVAAAIKECADKGHELAVVVGAGNIWRGRAGGDMDRTDADRLCRRFLVLQIGALFPNDLQRL